MGKSEVNRGIHVLKGDAENLGTSLHLFCFWPPHKLGGLPHAPHYHVPPHHMPQNNRADQPH